jgi:hypothetical protein
VATSKRTVDAITERLSEAEKAKVRRLCEPKPGTGKLSVSSAVLNKWRDTSGSGRHELYKIWADCNGDKERFLNKRLLKLCRNQYQV